MLKASPTSRVLAGGQTSMETDGPASPAPLRPLKQPKRNKGSTPATNSHLRLTVFLFLPYLIDANPSRHQSRIISPAPIRPHMTSCLYDQPGFQDLKGSSSDVA